MICEKKADRNSKSHYPTKDAHRHKFHKILPLYRLIFKFHCIHASQFMVFMILLIKGRSQRG